MQTFICDKDIKVTVKKLDYKRLGKQRLEAKQIIDNILRIHKGYMGYLAWKNHPCTLLWKNSVNSLKYYYNVVVEEWIKRGYRNTMQLYEEYDTNFPEWVYNDDLIYSHQASLIRKNPMYYWNKFDIDFLHHNHYFEKGYFWPLRDIPKTKKYILKSKGYFTLLDQSFIDFDIYAVILTIYNQFTKIIIVCITRILLTN